MSKTEALALQAENLGKRYGKQWALRDSSFILPKGRVAGLVGPNGAGKTTLMNIFVGLIQADAGWVTLDGRSIENDPSEVLPSIGFVAQEHPLYSSFTTGEMVRLGSALNPSWDMDLALNKIEALKIPMHKKCGQLSGGQQAQLALVLALAKRPEILILDEPFASLDPVAKKAFMNTLLENVAETQQTVLISSHQINDLARLCDSLVLLLNGKCLLAGDIDYLLASHSWVTVPKSKRAEILGKYPVISETKLERYSRFFLRTDGNFGPDDNDGLIEKLGLEELVLNYLTAEPALTGGLK